MKLNRKEAAYEKHIEKELNNYDFKLPPHPTDDELKKAILKSICDIVWKENEQWAETKYADGCHYKIKKYDEEDFKEIIKSCFCNLSMDGMVSPTALFELVDLSFVRSFMDDVFARQWRSVCLDLWQMFFIESKKDVTDFLVVDESSVRPFQDCNLYNIICQTDAGRQFLMQDFFYKISFKSLSISAVTSPLTGFAFIPCNDLSVPFDSHCCLSLADGNVKELREREDDFRMFIYAYCSGFGNTLSSRFRRYVEMSVKDKLLEMQSMQTIDLIKRYPQFRNHIALELL